MSYHGLYAFIWIFSIGSFDTTLGQWRGSNGYGAETQPQPQPWVQPNQWNSAPQPPNGRYEECAKTEHGRALGRMFDELIGKYGDIGMALDDVARRFHTKLEQLRGNASSAPGDQPFAAASNTAYSKKPWLPKEEWLKQNSKRPWLPREEWLKQNPGGYSKRPQGEWQQSNQGYSKKPWVPKEEWMKTNQAFSKRPWGQGAQSNQGYSKRAWSPKGEWAQNNQAGSKRPWLPKEEWMKQNSKGPWAPTNAPEAEKGSSHAAELDWNELDVSETTKGGALFGPDKNTDPHDLVLGEEDDPDLNMSSAQDVAQI